MTIANPATLAAPVWSQLWPLLVMLGIEALLSAAVAQLSSTAPPRDRAAVTR